VNIFLNL
jgi:hypothetical protein